jgi:hypothetical protein
MIVEEGGTPDPERRRQMGSEGDLYIIEHETRGVLTDVPFVDRDDKPHFSWSKPRGEARTFTLPRARQALDMRSMPDGCYILRYGSWERVR